MFKPLLDVKPREDVSHNHNYDLSLSLYKFVSFGFINSIIFVFCYFLYLFKCISGLLVFADSDDVFYTLSFYLRTLRTMSRFGWGARIVDDIKKN